VSFNFNLKIIRYFLPDPVDEVKVKVELNPEQATKAQMGSRGITLLFP
jgi:hypothetical protein